MLTAIQTRSLTIDNLPAIEVETRSDSVRYRVEDVSNACDRHRAALQAFLDFRPHLRGLPVEVEPIDHTTRMWVLMPWPEVTPL